MRVDKVNGHKSAKTILCESSIYHFVLFLFYFNKRKYFALFFFSFTEADMVSLTVVITFGALLGLTSAIQLIVISIVETVLVVINMYLVITYFKVKK